MRKESKKSIGRIAFDFDLTYTRDPKLFANIAKGLNKAGFEIYILSGRPASERIRTIQQIHESGISPDRFEGILLFPEMYKASDFNDDTIRRIGVWKSEMCLRLGIKMLFEDQSHSIGPIKRLSPNTIISFLI